jgi:1-phosphatidylinositol phosphodiesterase
MSSILKSSLKVSVISLILILSLVEVSHAHYHRAYYHDNRVLTHNPRWMTRLKDDVLLSQLSIPGTHDTMAFFGGHAVETQTLRLPGQLEAGIRVLDIRCRHMSDEFRIYHGHVSQRRLFHEVLDMVIEFLRQNPGETVLMRVKEEHHPSGVTRTFQQTFHQRYWVNEKYNRWMWQGTSVNPTLGDMRGKIVVLQDFDREASINPRYGIPYNSFVIQDDYKLRTNWDLYGKWLRVEDFLVLANRGAGMVIKYMNYLSASTGSFPYFVVSGHSNPATGARRLSTGMTTPAFRWTWLDFPRVSCFLRICTIAFEGTNVLTSNRLGMYRNRVGTIMTDFPGPLLIEQIIAINNRFRK